MAHRDPVRMNDRHQAAAVQLQHRLVGQRRQTLLVDHEEAGRVEPPTAREFATDLAAAQQVQRHQPVAQRAGAQRVALVALQEGQRLLQELGRLAVVGDQALALHRVEAGPGGVDGQRRRAVVGGGVGKRIAAQEGGNGRADPAPVGVDAEVLALAQAQQRHRCDAGAALAVAAGRHEGQRQLARQRLEFGEGDRHRIQRSGDAPVGDRHDPAVGMLLAGQQHRMVVERAGSGGGRCHGVGSSTGSSMRLASTLSTRLPSRSTTSKRQPSHSTASAVCGSRPSSSITMPARVL